MLEEGGTGDGEHIWLEGGLGVGNLLLFSVFSFLLVLSPL